MKTVSAFRISLLICFFVIFSTSESLYSQNKDTIPDSKGTVYDASNNGSDCYIYATWKDLYNACAIPTATTMVIDYYDYDNTTGGQYVVAGVVTYNGTAYSNKVGPSEAATFYFHPHYQGWFCDYWDPKSPRSAATLRIKPPKNVKATFEDYDSKIVITWDGSDTDVPTDRYDYRIYRDGVIVATVNYTSRTWTDTGIVPGVEYDYTVVTHSAYYGHKESIRNTVKGKAFDLNVRTESLPSGVKILWDLPSKFTPENYTIDRRAEGETAEFLKTVDSPTSNAWSDLDQGGVPIPGYSYTYIVTPWSSTKGVIQYRVDSATGNRIPDGAFSGKVTAPTGGAVSGVVVCAERLTDIPQGTISTYCDTTDGQGKFYIQNIYYYDSARFRITPTKEGHGFNPLADTSLLKLANHTLENINFTDTSSFTVTGRVYQVFHGDTCNVKDVEILVDDLSRGYTTDIDGIFNLTVDQTGTYTFKPQMDDRDFSPSERTYNIADDLEGIVFEDTTQYLLEGNVSGPCNIYIGTADFRIYSRTGACFDTSFSSDQVGRYSVMLPAGSYYMEMTSFTSDDEQVVTSTEVQDYFAATKSVDLTTGSGIQNFIFRKSPEVQVSGFVDFGCGTYAGIPILEQAKSYSLNINVVENFNGTTCNVDTGFVVVTYHPGDSTAQVDTLQLQAGKAVYNLVPETPNIISPYLNLLEVIAYVEGETDTYSQQVLVTGNRPRTATFVSVSPEIPFLILRDPPGDASYSFLSKGTTYESSISFSAQQSGSINAWAEVKLGAEFEAGQFVFVESKVWGQVKSSLEIGASLTEQTELGLSITNSEDFSTSGNDDITGETGDVFAGASLNMVYALTDVIDYDPDACSVDKSVDLIMAPEGFKTTFIYTENHIRNVLIPQLEQIRDLYTGVNEDSAKIYQRQIKNWEQILNLNTNLKDEAEFIENRSFSAGSPYQSSREVSISQSSTFEFGMYIDRTVAVEAGFEFGGSGISGGVDVNFRLDFGVSNYSGVVNSTTTGYVFDDDDVGDFFSVDILGDATYGTPVFRLKSGRSSCPWEEGTQPRDGVQLISDTYDQFISNPDDPAIFTLSLGNTSQSDEERTYDLVFLQESNPDGAVLTLGGSQVQGGIPTPYTIPAGSSVDATVTVQRGPEAYDYNNLIFVLESPCDGSISDEVSLNAHFETTCSDIALGKPLDNWMVNGKSNNTLPVQLLDYDLNNLESVEVQYSVLDANNWTAAAIYDVSQLDPDVTTFNWTPGNIPDGMYDIRAKLICSGVVKYSDIRSGIIDRIPPQVFGVPEPVDGMLDNGDLISVAFNEDINCMNISASNVVVTDINNNQVINAQVGCSGEEIIIIPDTTGLTFQNDTFKVQLTGVEDLYGNVADTLLWAFTVPGPDNFGILPGDDTDGDSIANDLDNCPLSYNPGQADLDSNGIGDLCDPDIDGDGIINEFDNCPFISNFDQADADSNLVGDVCDPDIDGDGIINDLDNCPLIANTNQEDADSNGVGDVCDATGIYPRISGKGYVLFDNYPNPFSDYTTFKYQLPQTCQSVQIKIFNVTGEVIAVLSNNETTSGVHESRWSTGSTKSGIYFYMIRVIKPDGTEFTGRKKMTIFR
ncbi:MAG: T9SS type A sorting domain-containing protein [Chlorobi bacterium]|nr:T9SS type A sorting domain-containing protein [Chlorobiota bacterium]